MYCHSLWRRRRREEGRGGEEEGVGREEKGRGGEEGRRGRGGEEGAKQYGQEGGVLLRLRADVLTKKGCSLHTLQPLKCTPQTHLSTGSHF